MELPPEIDTEAIRKELGIVAAIDREDCINEAWLAWAEGRDPVQAINTYAKRERRYRKRHADLPEHLPHDSRRPTSVQSARSKSRNSSVRAA